MKNYKQFILGFVVALLLTTTFSASANNLVKDIAAKVSYEINMKLNGKDFNPQEEDGAAIRPIMYNGRTYLPIRQLCEAVGVKVEWEGATKTIWLGERGNKFKMDASILAKDNLRKLYYTENPDMLFLGGKLYENGLRSVPTANGYSTFYFDTAKIAGKAAKIGGVIYIDESMKSKFKTVPVTFRKSKDENEEVLAVYDVVPGEPYTFELDTNNSNIVVLDVDPGGHDYKPLKNFAILDLYYKN